jgi:hypothetical protein
VKSLVVKTISVASTEIVGPVDRAAILSYMAAQHADRIAGAQGALVGVRVAG